MVAEQILCKVIQTSNYSIIEDNMLTVNHFIGFEEEFNFIKTHYEKYGNVPDPETFLAKFAEFKKCWIDAVNESDAYLVDTLREEYLYANSANILQQYAKLLQTDANMANEYLASQSQVLQPTYYISGTDIIQKATERQKEYEDRKANQKNFYFESGFKELDDIIHGIQRGEEFMVFVARLGQGKSWILITVCAHVWKTGFNVGYVSPEMSANMVGFRFDTVLNHFSNKHLMYGGDEEGYPDYTDKLREHKNKFMVATPADFNREITVSKLRSWIKQNSLDLIAIDGIKYLTDERGKKNDNATTALTNISEDLMEMSVELGVPVLVVVQANRGGVSSADDDGTPELEHIRDSDGIAHNATRVISLKQKTDGVLEMNVKKNRFGALGGKLNYLWNIDNGEFTYVPNDSRATSRRTNASTTSDSKQKYNDSKKVF
jgi:replicative DNA helicase